MPSGCLLWEKKGTVRLDVCYVEEGTAVRKPSLSCNKIIDKLNFRAKFSTLKYM